MKRHVRLSKRVKDKYVNGAWKYVTTWQYVDVLSVSDGYVAVRFKDGSLGAALIKDLG